MLAQSRRGNEERFVLVDFGYNPVAFLNNIELLKIAPEKIDAWC
jgi:7,8-dihydropterin-6-yl-methyl-4-(beta-D-ribofuranosyl)aminobenzene 5'-phosphate synthase